MAKVRKANGQLVETEVQATDGLASAPGAPAPLTPAGAAAQGQTPDQAKMVGTPAQKAPVLREAVSATGQADRAARYTPPAPQSTPADQQAKEKAGNLLKMGSYGSALTTLITNQLAAVKPTAEVKITASADNITKMFPDDPTKATAVQGAVNAYLAAPTPESMKAVALAMGRESIDPATMRSLTTTADEAITAALKTPGVTAVAPTVGQLDLSSLGLGAAPLATLAKDLGKTEAEVAAMSPDQLQQAIQDTITREYSKVNDLKAEYRTASPNRKAQILEEIRASDASGRAGVEASVAHLSDVLESQEKVMIGGAEHGLKDIFSDDGMSDLVMNAVTSPDAMAELKTLSPSLATWIETNRTSLENLAADITAGAKAFDEGNVAADETMADLGIAGTPLAAAFNMPEGPMTPAESAAWIASVKDDPLFQAATSNKELNAALADPVTGPELVAAWKDLEPGAIQTLMTTSNNVAALSEDQRAILKSLGIEPTAGRWLTDPAEAKLARNYMALFERYPTVDPTELRGLLDGLKPNVFKSFTQGGNLNHLMQSMEQLKRYPAESNAGKALRSFLGLGSSATYMKPGTKGQYGEPIDIKAMTDAFASAASALGQVAGEDGKTYKAQFYKMINDGTLSSPEDLAAVAKNPALLRSLEDSREAAATVAVVETHLQNGKFDSARNNMAAALVPGVKTWEDLRRQFAGAYNTLNNNNAQPFSKESQGRAKEFLKLLAKSGLDIDGNGVVDQSDFETLAPTDEKDQPIVPLPARSKAALAKLLKEIKTRGVGDENKDTILGGKAKPSTLPQIDWAKISSPGYFEERIAGKTGVEAAGDAAVADAEALANSRTVVSDTWHPTGDKMWTGGPVDGVNSNGHGVWMFKHVRTVKYKDNHSEVTETKWLPRKD